MMVLGVDGATWDLIKPRIDELPTFKKLTQEAKAYTMTLKQKPWSASVWCSMFTGLTPEQHNHLDFVKDGKIQTREDVQADFIWDLLDLNGVSVKVLNIPFIVPPYHFNVDFKAPANGVPITIDECEAEIQEVTKKCIDILENDKPEVFIMAYTATDKMGHMHWGEEVLFEFYKKVDSALGKLLSYDDEFIIISDHGFCDYDDAPIQTLPKITSAGNELKGDHHPDAIVVTKNIDMEIKEPMDVFRYIQKKYLG